VHQAKLVKAGRISQRLHWVCGYQVYSIFSAYFNKPAETLYRCVFRKFCRLWFLVDDE